MSPTIYPDRPSQPLPSEPPPPVSPPVEEEEWESPFPEKPKRASDTVTYRGATSDPTFGYLIVVALCIGLIPLIPENTDLRYTLLWTVMAGFGVLSWLLGNSARIWTETPENLGWGVIFGLIIAVPLLIVGGTTLRETDQRIFANLSVGEVLAFLIFVMPLAETLFFRGVIQEIRPFWMVGILSSIWSILLFFPVLEANTAVALVVGTALVMMNIIYSYVRQRNGLAAAWICQIVVNLVLLFIPFLS
jgi:membrane protease YdiL (CAAX protease family)